MTDYKKEYEILANQYNAVVEQNRMLQKQLNTTKEVIKSLIYWECFQNSNISFTIEDIKVNNKK